MEVHMLNSVEDTNKTGMNLDEPAPSRGELWP